MKFKKVKGNEGKVSIEFLIGAIILVIAFVIILYFIFIADFKPTINKETCHQSIVYRSSLGIGGPLGNVAKEAVPLKCQTELICLTMSGNDCGLFSTKDNPVRKIKLDKNPVKAREEIIEAFGDSLVSCHSMLGEGKLSFMPADWTKRSETRYGLICSRIVFDDQVKNEIRNIPYSSIYTHLEKKPIGDESALEYLYPGWKNSRNSVNLFTEIQQKGEGKEKIQNINFKDWKIDLTDNRGFAIIAIEAPIGKGDALLKGGAVAGTVVAVSVASVVFLPVGIIAGATILAVGTGAGAAAGGAVLWYNYDDKFNYAAPTIIPFDVGALQGLKVNSFEIAP